jgi:hypothetical protein
VQIPRLAALARDDTEVQILDSLHTLGMTGLPALRQVDDTAALG